MNYPVWDLAFLGSGLVVAIIATIHIFISHFAIGGGIFLWVAEWWSGREPDGAKIREWLHKYATFFLIYTTVFGAMTGVGIWFAIQLASAEGTSLLIHQFVFVWASEWVLFLGELTVLYLYYYGWKTNSPRLQLWLAGLYALISWGSLFAINGILTFMLTPGDWNTQNLDIAAGFFNPGFWPSLFIRTLVMILLGGLGGMVIASRIENEELKEKTIRFCVKFVIPAAILTPFFAVWYWTVLPASASKLIEGGVVGVGGGRMEAITAYFLTAVVAGAMIVLASTVVYLKPKALTMMTAIAIFLIGMTGITGAEFVREMARKPFVIHGVLYSNSLWKNKAADPDYLAQPYLEKAKWHPSEMPSSLERGEWLFRLQCISCHTRDGYRAMKKRTASWSGNFGVKWFERMHEQGVMPPFEGSLEDRAALTEYLLSLHGKKENAADILKAVEAELNAEKTKMILQEAGRVPDAIPPEIPDNPEAVKDVPADENGMDVQKDNKEVLQ